MKSAEYQRGYDAGYKQALLDALAQNREMGQALKGRSLRERQARVNRVRLGFGERAPWET